MDFSCQSLAYPCCNYWLHRSYFGMDRSQIILLILVLVGTSVNGPISFFQSHCQERELFLCDLQHLLFLWFWLWSEGKYSTRQRAACRVQREMQTEEHFQAHLKRKLSSALSSALQISHENRRLQCRWVLCQECIGCKETRETSSPNVKKVLTSLQLVIKMLNCTDW